MFSFSLPYFQTYDNQQPVENILNTTSDIILTFQHHCISIQTHTILLSSVDNPFALHFKEMHGKIFANLLGAWQLDLNFDTVVRFTVRYVGISKFTKEIADTKFLDFMNMMVNEALFLMFIFFIYRFT